MSPFNQYVPKIDKHQVKWTGEGRCVGKNLVTKIRDALAPLVGVFDETVTVKEQGFLNLGHTPRVTGWISDTTYELALSIPSLDMNGGVNMRIEMDEPNFIIKINAYKIGCLDDNDIPSRRLFRASREVTQKNAERTITNCLILTNHSTLLRQYTTAAYFEPKAIYYRVKFDEKGVISTINGLPPLEGDKEAIIHAGAGIIKQFTRSRGIKVDMDLFENRLFSGGSDSAL
ncbi:MAG: hypothetical protein QY312_02740 [Candidatus Dojkabacteria bacterium]|nr:MAG: hypothetical protein QY312_02740 [Candidatus Dojkabacteria bacterium]